jgi:hypothetical protein
MSRRLSFRLRRSSLTIHQAAQQNDVEEVRQLAKRKSTINSVDEHGRTR